MARDVHDTAGGWRGLACVALLWLTACGPIEPEPAEANRPPYIPPDRARPPQGVVDVDELNGGAVELAVTELLDPNDEEQLFYTWIGNERGVVRRPDAVGSRSTTTTIGGETYHTFREVSVQLDNPCEVVESGNRKETIWLYVSDRPFENALTGDIVAGRGAYVVSRAWVLEYAPQLCAN